MADAMLQVKGLTKRFGGLTAVDHVEFRIEPFETLAMALVEYA